MGIWSLTKQLRPTRGSASLIRRSERERKVRQLFDAVAFRKDEESHVLCSLSGQNNNNVGAFPSFPFPEFHSGTCRLARYDMCSKRRVQRKNASTLASKIILRPHEQRVHMRT